MGDPLPAVRPLDDAAWNLAERADDVPSKVVAEARRIVAAVRAGGDGVLRDLTKRLDGCDLEDPFLSAAEWTKAAARVPAEVQQAIDDNLRRIRAFHKLQTAKEQRLTVVPGVQLGRRPIPLDAVACYVPGGRANYPSTALMTVVPAQVAGCKTIIVATPPQRDGSIDPAVLYAAKQAGATHILRAGGAQAIAALAYGTKRIPRVKAIVGPGNAYVTAAKQAVANHVRIDAPAGPSELLVVADAAANPQRIALDLLAQAEHDPDAQVLLVTTSQAVADQVRTELLRRLPNQTRAAIIEASLREHAGLFVAKTLKEALAFANHYAAEHLSLFVKDPRKALRSIENAGSVFLGDNAPVTLGDYGSGTNHVLPTMGHARVRGGLSVEDFRKWITWQEVTATGLRNIGPSVATFARAEGLDAHAQAVEERLQGEATTNASAAAPAPTTPPKRGPPR